MGSFLVIFLLWATNISMCTPPFIPHSYTTQPTPPAFCAGSQSGPAMKVCLTVGFFGMLRQSNLAPNTRGGIDPTKHTYRDDRLVADPGQPAHSLMVKYQPDCWPQPCSSKCRATHWGGGGGAIGPPRARLVASLTIFPEQSQLTTTKRSRQFMVTTDLASSLYSLHGLRSHGDYSHLQVRD